MFALPQRFWDKVEQTASCWLWTGTKIRGYGQFRFDGKVRSAHRLSYRAHVGDIADGFQIDHLCRNPSCVNPEHLEAVSPQENTLRSEGVTAANARRTTCRAGHALVRRTGTTWRRCRICENAAQNARRAAQRQALVAADEVSR